MEVEHDPSLVESDSKLSVAAPGLSMLPVLRIQKMQPRADEKPVAAGMDKQQGKQRFNPAPLARQDKICQHKSQVPRDSYLYHTLQKHSAGDNSVSGSTQSSSSQGSFALELDGNQFPKNSDLD